MREAHENLTVKITQALSQCSLLAIHSVPPHCSLSAPHSIAGLPCAPCSSQCWLTYEPIPPLKPLVRQMHMHILDLQIEQIIKFG